MPDAPTLWSPRALRAWRIALLIFVPLSVAWEIYRWTATGRTEHAAGVVQQLAFCVVMWVISSGEGVRPGSPDYRRNAVIGVVATVVMAGALAWKYLR